MYLAALSGLGSSLYGLSLGVLSYRAYIMQREILKGEHKNAAFSVGANQSIQAAVLLLTIANVFPGVYSSTALSVAMSTYPILASIVSGGYEKIRTSLQFNKGLREHSNFLIKAIDDLIDRIPKNIAKPLARNMRISHRWMGTTFIAAQLALLGSMAFGMQPLIGVFGVTYLAVAELRSRNKLPLPVSKAIEKVDYWIGLFSGVLLRSTALRLTAGLRIGYELVLKFVMPTAMRKLIGIKSEFMQFYEHEQAAKPKPRITSEVTGQQFEDILLELPPVKNLDKNSLNKSRLDLLKSEIKGFTDSVFVEAQQRFVAENATGLQSSASSQANARVSLSDNILQGFNFAKHLAQVTPMKFSERENDQKYTLTALHMSHVPKVIPPIEFDLVGCKAKLEQHYLNMARDFTQMCFDSEKFYPVDSEYVDLKKERAILESESNKLVRGSREWIENQASIRKNTEAQTVVKQQLIDGYREKFKLPYDTTNEQVIAKYFKTQMHSALAEIEHAKTLLANKKVDSIHDFKLMGMHVLNKAMQLLDGTDTLDTDELISPENKAYQMLATLAIEGGDACSTGIFDAVQQLFQDDVLKGLLPTLNLSAYDMVALYLQDQRQNLFDQIYAEIGQNTWVRTYFPEIEFNDRHTYVSVAKAMSSLRLKASFNAMSELSGQSRGFMTEMGIELIAYIVLRVMTGFEHGYSVEYITSAMNDENKFKGSGTIGFRIIDCIDQWAKEKGFSPEVQESIADILTGYSEHDNESRRKLCFMMLYDMQILDCNDQDAQRYIEIRSPAARQHAIEKSSSLTHAWGAAQTAYSYSAWGLSKAVEGATNVINFAMEIEKDSHQYTEQVERRLKFNVG